MAQSHNLAGLGVVLLHGKGGTPTSMIEGLNESLRKEGALVDAPELPWSARRIYDATYEQAMTEIDAAVERLKLAGAKNIAVIGHSLGANAAIGYAARSAGALCCGRARARPSAGSLGACGSAPRARSRAPSN